MRTELRTVAGILVGGGAVGVYLFWVGFDSVAARFAGLLPWLAAVAACLVVVEGLTDSIGVWASVEPLGDGLSADQSVQFALAGDFFDTVSPAGPVSSEPIMARFISVTTGSTYSDALAVRGVAKYIKAGTQALFSTVLAATLLLVGPSPQFLVYTMGGAVVGLVALAVVLLWSRAVLSRAVVAVLAPLVSRVSALYRSDPHDRSVVTDAVERFWSRILYFREAPHLLAYVALAGVVEQLVVAGALWATLEAVGVAVPLLPIVAIVPLPRLSVVLPVPASLGAYDVFLGGALVVMTGAPADGAAAAVVLFRTLAIAFALTAGGISVAFLRGWRP
ncbi:lysylphosphatidylglycerol synthase domain-containing protein [Salinibaculum salinum]|uniref:lysylphosphatidylglycerol synthase domain-containing protein n=1 Tax=Salinibaculum salinum TaxID=3131996 RepID=UPI0030EB5BED